MKNSLEDDKEDKKADSGCDAKKRRKMNEEFCSGNVAGCKNNCHNNSCFENNVEKSTQHKSETKDFCQSSEFKDEINEENKLTAADNENATNSGTSESKSKTADQLLDEELVKFGRLIDKDCATIETDRLPKVTSPSVENDAQNAQQTAPNDSTSETNVFENVAFSSNAENLENCPSLRLNENLRENSVFSTSPSMETARDLDATRSSADENWTTDNEAMEEEGHKDESDEEDKTDSVPNQPLGRHKFAFAHSIQNRQCGFTGIRKYGSPNRKRGFEAVACDPRIFERNFLGSVRLVQKLKLSKKLDLHGGCVNCLHFNSDGSRLASGSDDLRVCVWDWARGKPLIVFKSGHRGNVFQAKFMPLSGDCHIVTCSRDGQVRLADLSTCNVSRGTRLLAQHKGAAHKLALLNDSPHVFLTCGEDGAVFEIDLRDPNPNKLLVVKNPANKNRAVPLYSIHASPANQNHFAVSGRDNFCRVYDRKFIGTAGSSSPSEPVQKFSPSHLIKSTTENSRSYHNANVTSLVYNHNGTELLASYNDDDVYLFDTKFTSENGDGVLHRYTGHRNNATIKGVNFYGPNSEFVVSGSDCGHIYFWDRETEQVVNFLHGDDNGVVNVLEPHPSFALLATSGLDNEAKLWEPIDDQAEFDQKLLRKLIKSNAKYRESDRMDQGNVFDAHMLGLMISRMRRATRQRTRQQAAGEPGDRATSAEEDGSTNDVVDSPTSGTDGDDDGGGWGDGDVDDQDDDEDDHEEDEDGAPLLTCRTS